MALKVVAVFLAVCAAYSMADPVPLVIWHGMGE